MSDLVLIKPTFIEQPKLFLNTSYFSEAANYFKKHGFYTSAPEGTYAYQEYWDEQDRRCKEGYTVGGTRITGEHYAYLNFGRIKVTSGTGKTARKYDDFPKFTDMDYYYYHELEQAKINKQGIIVAKARRKGFSYKGAFNTVYEYNWYRDSFSIISAFMGDYCQTTMNMALDMINFLNKHTDWAKRKLIDTRTHIKSGFKEKNSSNIEVESGYKSEIMTMSFKDNPFKSIGKSSSVMLFEEAGKWPGLIDAYMLSKPLFSDGDIMIGIPIIYGTGGDMEAGTQDFAEMFYNPQAYGLRAYKNIWDEEPNPTGCGWFVPDSWYKEPNVDINGNSILEKSTESILRKRDLVKKTGSKKAYEKEVTQQPLTPAEAFLRTTGNRFPSTDLLARLSKLQTDKSILNADYIGDLIITETGKIEWKHNDKLTPIRNFPIRKDEDTEGCVVIYEHPKEDEAGEVPYGRYICGLDPYSQNEAQSSDSLGSCVVYDKLTKRIVAEYTARPITAEVFYENVRRLIKYYRAICLYENQVPGFFQYLSKYNETYMLMDQPDYIKDIIKDSKVERGKGMHMTVPLKEHGEDLINSWLREPYEGDNDVMNLHKIRSIPLLQELIAYNDKGNFDRIISLICVMYAVQQTRKHRLDELKEENDILNQGFFNKLQITGGTRFNL